MPVRGMCSYGYWSVIFTVSFVQISRTRSFDSFTAKAEHRWDQNTRLEANIDEAGRLVTTQASKSGESSLLDADSRASIDAKSLESKSRNVPEPAPVTSTRVMRSMEHEVSQHQPDSQHLEQLGSGPMAALEDGAARVEQDKMGQAPLMCKAKTYKDGSPLCFEATHFFHNGQSCSIACKVLGSYGLGWFYTAEPDEEISCRCTSDRCDWVPALPYVKCALNFKRAYLTCTFVFLTFFIICFGCVYSLKESISRPKPANPVQ